VTIYEIKSIEKAKFQNLNFLIFHPYFNAFLERVGETCSYELLLSQYIKLAFFLMEKGALI